MIGRVRRVIGAPATLVLAILLLATSALSGNVFQNADRSSLRSDLKASRDETAELQTQLALVKGQQECRSQIASESELYSGRLLAGVGGLITATQAGDQDGAKAAVNSIAAATVALIPALDARLDSVEICERDPDFRSPVDPTSAPATTTTTAVSTTKPKSKVSRTTTTQPTSTTGSTTSTTIHHSSPSPTSPPCSTPLPGITVPGGLPCL